MSSKNAYINQKITWSQDSQLRAFQTAYEMIA